jgi:hypothetical protein
MATGTNRKMRALTMRQDRRIIRTRAFRPRLFPTQYGHAALHRAIDATCAYQSDSSSKRPVASAVSDAPLHPAPPRCLAPHGPHRPRAYATDHEDPHEQPSYIDKGSFHISYMFRISRTQ